MGVTKLTALTIQSWPNTMDMKGNGIYVTGGRTTKVLWSGLIYFVEGKGVNRLLLSTEPLFDSKSEATIHMRRVVEKIRDLLLLDA